MERAGNYRIGRTVRLISRNRIEISFEMPGAPFGRRTIKEPENHCLMRAFDIALVHGRSNPGKIDALILYDPSRGGYKCLASFAVTNYCKGKGILEGHRIVLFPSWKSHTGHMAFIDSSGIPTPFDAHHITFEPNSDGTLNCHARLPDRGKRPLPLYDRPAKGGWIRLCQVFINEHHWLDPVGQLKRSFHIDSDPESTVVKWRQTLREHLPDRHTLMIPPDLYNKNKDSVVWATMYLTDSPLKPSLGNALDPTFLASMPSERVRQPFKTKRFSIKIHGNLYLLISLHRIDAPLQQEILWGFG